MQVQEDQTSTNGGINEVTLQDDEEEEVAYVMASTRIGTMNQSSTTSTDNQDAVPDKPLPASEGSSAESPNPSPTVQLSPVGIGVQPNSETLSGRQKVFSDARSQPLKLWILRWMTCTMYLGPVVTF